MFGRPVVHGLHVALWMIDRFAAQGGMPLPYRTITARFNRPLFVDEGAQIQSRDGAAGTDLQCTSDGMLLTQLKLSDPGVIARGSWAPQHDTWSRTPAEPAIDALAHGGGRLALPYRSEEIAQLFPAALQAYGPAALAHLLALTRIVGMELPGLNSLFGGFSVRFQGGHGTHIDFTAARFSPRTSHLQIRVQSEVLSGVADAFWRPPPSAVERAAVVRAVAAGEFAGRRSLVIGGSRGLGLVSAYMLAAGGADVVLTYRVGRDEAEAACAAIRAAGGRANAIPLDAAAPEAGFAALAAQDFRPTDVYYFATPHIFERKKALFEPDLFQRFAKSYVSDFAGVVAACRTLCPHGTSVFFPSSDALDHPVRELVEYAAAKAAGEAYCEMAARFAPEISILTARLPRLPTDQTATLMKVGAADPAEVIMGICRKMGRPAVAGPP